MSELAVAFLWHQHQPYYLDDVGGHNPMPWVRLHGTKDYWGMAMHLAEIPQMHATINLVPSLVAQILAYTEGGHEDEHLRISRLPADSLTQGDLHYLLDNFFMVHADQMIRPYRRYHELYQQRGFSVDTAARAAQRFSTRDILDLQCWNNLVWMHPIAFERDADLAEFRRKGERYSESDKQWLLAKQMELLREIIPLHKQLADAGQLELTTTPFYHPILPLLCDKRLARQAMPDVHLPERLEHYAEDASAQVRRAVDYHRQIFGSRREACGLPRARSRSSSCPSSPRPASSGSPPTKRFSVARPTAGSLAMARAFCGTRRCSIAPGAVKSAASSCRSSSAITP